MENKSTSVAPVLPPSVQRKFVHPREYPQLPKNYTWERQKREYSPPNLLKNGKIQLGSNRALEFGYVFCHRGLYERSSRIVDNSASAIENGVRQGLFLHEIDVFDWDDLHQAFAAHDENRRRVTKKEERWNELSFSEIRQTHLVTRTITEPIERQGQPPDFDSQCLTTDDRVLPLYDLLWKERLQPSGITIQLDLRNEDFAKALAYHSYHLSRQFFARRNGQKIQDTLSWSLLKPVILKGYNKFYDSFQDLFKAIRKRCLERYGQQTFEEEHLPQFPPLIMVFYSKYLVRSAKNKGFRGSKRKLALEPTSDPAELREIYEHILDVAQSQIESFVGLCGGSYDFILEIVHSGLGLGYDKTTGTATNPLNGSPLYETRVIFGSCVDRALIDVHLNLKKKFPHLLFSSCTRLPDVIEGRQKLRASHASSRLEEWAPVPPEARAEMELTDRARGEYNIAPTLRATHGGLYPQADLVVADDPAAEIAARTWIDQYSGLNRRKLLLKASEASQDPPASPASQDSQDSQEFQGYPKTEWCCYKNWLRAAHRGLGVARALAVINGPFHANTYGGLIKDNDTNVSDEPRPENMLVDAREKVVPWLNTEDGQSRTHAGSIVRPASEREPSIENTPRTPPMSVITENEGRVVFSSRSGNSVIDSTDEASGALSMLGVKPTHDRHFSIKAGTRHIRIQFEPPTESDPERAGRNKEAYTAAEKGNENELKTYIAAGININFWNKNRGTVLGAACSKDDDRIVRYLLEQGADIDAGPNNKRPLEVAAGKGHFRIVKLLLDRGARVNSVEQSPCSALAHACLVSHLGIINLLLRQEADVNGGPVNPCFYTPLQAACHVGNRQIVELLLRRGAKIAPAKQLSGDFQGPFKLGPFALACGSGHESIVTRLLEKLDPGMWPPNYLRSRTPGQPNKLSGYPKPTPHSRSRIPELDRGLVVACKGAHVEVVRLLLNIRARPDSEDLLATSGTPLMAACCGTKKTEPNEVKTYHERQMKVINMLILRNAAINFHGGPYGTALATACAHSEPEIVKLLLDKGADVQEKPANQRSALFWTYQAGSPEIVQILMDKGAKLDFPLSQQPSSRQLGAHALLVKSFPKATGKKQDVNRRANPRPLPRDELVSHSNNHGTTTPGTTQHQASQCGCLTCRVDDSLHNDPRIKARRTRVVSEMPGTKTKEYRPRKE